MIVRQDGPANWLVVVIPPPAGSLGSLMWFPEINDKFNVKNLREGLCINTYMTKSQPFRLDYVLPLVVAVVILAACTSDAPDDSAELVSAEVSTTVVTLDSTPALDAAPDESSETVPEVVVDVTTPRPPWLGSRTIPTDSAGRGLPIDTPPELLDRRLATVDTLPPPTMDKFQATSELLSERPDVLARSTWAEGCPVAPDALSYLTLAFWGFDEVPHTGEMIVAASEADGVIQVFNRLFDARFPIEEMRVVTPADIDALPTGDGNNTTGYVCRSVTGGSSFSEHAKGLAIDINPFHNPYQRDDVVLPEQATAYLDRSGGQTGVVTEGDVVHQAFVEIGWEWGGAWQSLKDYQHFSATGL